MRLTLFQLTRRKQPQGMWASMPHRAPLVCLFQPPSVPCPGSLPSVCLVPTGGPPSSADTPSRTCHATFPFPTLPGCTQGPPGLRRSHPGHLRPGEVYPFPSFTRLLTHWPCVNTPLMPGPEPGAGVPPTEGRSRPCLTELQGCACSMSPISSE